MTTAGPGGTQDPPAPVLAHLGLGDTFREAPSVSPMDMVVGDDLILGWDWTSSRDLRLLYVDGRDSLRVGACTASGGPPARRGPPRAAHADGYRPRGVSPAPPPDRAGRP